MVAKLRSWWQFIKTHRVTIQFLAIFLAIAIILILIGYLFDWTGFNGYNKVTITHIISGTNAGTVTKTEEHQPGKALWDWLGLLGVLAVPIVVGFGAAWYTAQQGKVSDRENTDNQRETALQAYIDKMSDLLLEKHLREPPPEAEAQKIARVRTLTVLPRLDGERKRSVLQFLYESGLIVEGQHIIDLHGADLSEADLSFYNLSRADLHGAILKQANLFETTLDRADLSESYLQKADLRIAKLVEAKLRKAFLLEANLSGANLQKSDLQEALLDSANLNGAILLEANLQKADLSRADLSGAFFNGADLRGAKVTAKQLDNAESLQGATMPDGSIHP